MLTKSICALLLLACILLGCLLFEAKHPPTHPPAQIALRLERSQEYMNHLGQLRSKGQGRLDGSALATHAMEVIETGALYPGLTRMGDVLELFRANLVFVTPHKAIVDLGRNVSLAQPKRIGITWIREDVQEPQQNLHWVLTFDFSPGSDLLSTWNLTCLPSY